VLQAAAASPVAAIIAGAMRPGIAARLARLARRRLETARAGVINPGPCLFNL
jgi:hypothetical protein